MVALCHRARDVGYAKSSSPLFIWASWVAARVLFSKLISHGPLQNRAYRLVHAFLSHRDGPDDDFDTIVSSLKESARYWTLASELSQSLCLLMKLSHQTNMFDCSRELDESGSLPPKTPKTTPTSPTQSTSCSIYDERLTLPSWPTARKRHSIRRESSTCRTYRRGRFSRCLEICIAGLICLRMCSRIWRRCRQ